MSHQLPPLPSTDQIAAIPLGEIPAAMAQLAAAQSLLAARLLSEKPIAEVPELVKIDVAAAKLGVKEDWLYRHADDYTFTRRISPKQLRFDLRGLERYLSGGRKAA